MRQFLIVISLASFVVRGGGQDMPNKAALDFAGGYTSLKPEQKALVDDWMKRFSETIRKQIDPEVAYDNLPLSTRTTFNAVTHALLSTALTDTSGGKLGSEIGRAHV